LFTVSFSPRNNTYLKSPFKRTHVSCKRDTCYVGEEDVVTS